MRSNLTWRGVELTWATRSKEKHATTGQGPQVLEFDAAVGMGGDERLELRIGRPRYFVFSDGEGCLLHHADITSFSFETTCHLYL